MSETDYQQPVASLEQLLDQLGKAPDDGDRVSLGQIIESIGQRSFGPLLLVAGVITMLPIIGDIPGMTTLMAVFVLLIAGQLLMFRKHLWLPRWLLKRSVSTVKFHKALAWMRRPARFVDRLIWPRLTVFARSTATYVIAVTCLLIAVVMPVMEVIPFSANFAGAALTAFGLSLIARDGLLALLAILLSAGAIVFIINAWW